MTRSFVHQFIRILTPFIFFVSMGVNGAENQRVSVKSAKKNSTKTVESKPIDFFSKKKMELIKELDDIMREMIWLIRSQRPVANKTLYGKVYRALQQAKGVRLTEKNKHTCDQYQLEMVSPYQYRIYEHCQKHRTPDLLAKIDWSQNRVTFQFQGQNYADVLGVSASLVAPVVDCQVTIEGDAKLLEWVCEGFRITRADNVVRFQEMIYKKNKNPMMVMKGEVLKNLLPYSDLTISVPLAGDVKILEKKKVPDSDETTPEEKAKQKPQPVVEKPKLVPVPAPAPINPREPEEPVEYVVPVDPVQVIKPPRDSEEGALSEEEIQKDANQQNPSNIMLKNSQPDVIEIQEPITQPPARPER